MSFQDDRKSGGDGEEILFPWSDFNLQCQSLATKGRHVMKEGIRLVVVAEAVEFSTTISLTDDV
jgi:hypothetical protein